MIKFTIIVPKKDGAWRIDTENMHSKRKFAKTVFSLLERKMVAFAGTSEGLKTCVKVRYLDNTTNESNPSSNLPEQLYAATAFLEDYLPQKALKRLTKKYQRDKLRWR